jgi:hypothetical protein
MQMLAGFAGSHVAPDDGRVDSIGFRIARDARSPVDGIIGVDDRLVIGAE